MSHQINPAGLKLVKQFEGLYLQPYTCPAGVWTIGYGHTDGINASTANISEAEADALLAKDLAKVAAAIEKLVKVKLHSNQFSALCSFTFNVGVSSLQHSTLLKKLNAGHDAAVPAEMARWNKAREPASGQLKVLKGLVARRAAEASLWLESHDSFINASTMAQSVSADEHGYQVIARKGLNLRSGAGLEFSILELLPAQKKVFVLREKEGWAAIDLDGDGLLDGWALADFLREYSGV
ncbi:glycoside hydrolase family protein [Iodobacter arcticus]|uniref:Lysozyme n=1 Tax=Iodobacter arcticus TaxID=590593 RepID=A0ABW2QRF8_9NEIS